jgi:hypothetical protein
VLPLLAKLLEKSGGFAMVEPRHPPGYGAALYARHHNSMFGNSSDANRAVGMPQP